MSRLIATLMAATMMLPTAAMAQERGEDRGGRRLRADTPQDVGEARQRPWRDQMQSVDRRDADAPRRDIDRPADRPRPDFRPNDGRGNDGRENDGRGNDGRGNAGWRNGGRADDGRWNDGRADADRQDGRRDDGRGDRDRRYDGQRADRDWRRDDGRRYNAGRYGGGRPYDPGVYGNRWYSDRDTGNRGGWNRGWRNDSQYDWSRYRAAHRDVYRLPRYYAPSGWGGGYRRFGIGVTLSSGLWGRNYWIADPYAYRLPDAYGPYRWVRYYGDALLVDLRTGLVVDGVYDLFW